MKTKQQVLFTIIGLCITAAVVASDSNNLTPISQAKVAAAEEAAKKKQQKIEEYKKKKEEAIKRLRKNKEDAPKDAK